MVGAAGLFGGCVVDEPQKELGYKDGHSIGSLSGYAMNKEQLGHKAQLDTKPNATEVQPKRFQVR